MSELAKGSEGPNWHSSSYESFSKNMKLVRHFATILLIIITSILAIFLTYNEFADDRLFTLIWYGGIVSTLISATVILWSWRKPIKLDPIT